jgi:hypothetical protein
VAGRRLIVAGTLDRHEALFLWLALAGLLMLMRAERARRRAADRAGRALPVHRRRGSAGDDPLEAERPRRHQGGGGGAPRPRQGRPWSTDAASR